MPDTYDVGAVVRARGAFTTRDLTATERNAFVESGALPAGVGLDPTAVTGRWRIGPTGTISTVTPVRQAAGSYYFDIDTSDGPGEYRYRLEGTGANKAAGGGRFQVRASDF